MKFLLDEMLPPDAAAILRDRYDHDAVHVSEIGLRRTLRRPPLAEPRNNPNLDHVLGR